MSEYLWGVWVRIRGHLEVKVFRENAFLDDPPAFVGWATDPAGILSKFKAWRGT